MIKKSIRNLHSDKQVPPRFCDVVIDNGKVFLEKKIYINTYTHLGFENARES